MDVEPSCPALVVHEDDAFRKSLIAALDARNFTVTVAEGDEALQALEQRAYHIAIIGIDLKSGRGLRLLEQIRANGSRQPKGVILLGGSDPELSRHVKKGDELLRKPVDPAYVAQRARTYCAS